MTKLEIKALFEGAYAQTPTFPGYWLKYDEFCEKFNELVASRSDIPVDVEKVLSEFYPDAAFMEQYQLQGSEDVFCALRIAPNKLVLQKDLKKKIAAVISDAKGDSDGWKNFAVVGAKGLKPEILSMGFIGIRQAVECLFRGSYEFRSGDPTKHEAPVLVREKNKSKLPSDALASNLVAMQGRLRKNPKQGSYIGDAIDSFAYFPRPKNSTTYGWDAAINDLATNIALEEKWYYFEEDKQKKPILKNYLSYTFERLQYEDDEEKQKAAKENRDPILKILVNEKHALFNTGLVNNIYEPIYAFFKKNDGSNPAVTQPWIFVAFETANSFYQNIITDFPYRPKRAEYFTDSSYLFYDTNAAFPTLNWKHFFKDNIDRLPLGFVKKGAPDSYPFYDNPDVLPKPQRDAYFKKLADDIYNDEDWLQYLTTRFKNALNITLSRVAWNYKTAIPMYYVERHQFSLLLPLALEKKDVVDVALVLEHKVNKERKVNNYVGRTIYTLEMAYKCARLITRPDSDWLMANMSTK
jgi:hypothetical protein